MGMFCLINVSALSLVGGCEGVGFGVSENAWAMLGRFLPLFCELSKAVKEGGCVFRHQMRVCFFMPLLQVSNTNWVSKNSIQVLTLTAQS